MISGIRGRASFAELRRHGRQVSSGPLWIVFHAPVTPEPRLRLAFAIARTAGTAVKRNRVRRQARAFFQELARTEPQRLPPGDYLVGLRAPLDGGGEELRNRLEASLGKLQRT